MSEQPDFWYVLGSDYEVIIFRSRDEAIEYRDSQAERASYYYFHAFEGRFGVEFSGWVGGHNDEIK
jgi:hypothetical protein